MSEIKFKRDTRFRKTLFSPDSFAHPAKMDAQLLLWVVERYTKTCETILDPMAGSGTAMIGCTVGRNIVQVELEQKFVDMQKANWDKVRMMPQLGHEMGECHIIQGDARQLGDILADHAIFSPPYAETGACGPTRSPFWERLANDPTSARYGRQKHPSVGEGYSPASENIGNLPYGDIDSTVTSPPYAEAQEGAGIAKRGYQGPKHGPTDLVGKRSYMPDVHGESEGQIGNLPYGSIDSVITSPPYEGSDISQTHMTSNKRGDPSDPNYRPSWTRKLADGYADSKRPYREVDSIVTSPPYEEGGGHGRGQRTDIVNEKHIYTKGAGMYSESKENIGEMRGTSYLSAMLQVYEQCHKVLKPGGLMVVVTKNFIRNKKEVRLDEDTIRLCEQAGFEFVERHYRKLPAQSFWRVIYQRKYPDAPVLDKEDILVFRNSG